MPLFLFQCPTENRVAGAVDCVVVRTPFWKTKADPRSGQAMYHPQTRQPLMEPDAQKTWQWLNTQGLPLSPGANYSGMALAPTSDQKYQPQVICVQIIPPTVQQHAQLHAPFGSPVGNSGAPITQPPQADPNWRPGMPAPYRQDPFETLDNSALPGGSDSMLGDVDPSGGTFTDIDTQGNEIQRVDRRQYNPQQPR